MVRLFDRILEGIVCPECKTDKLKCEIYEEGHSLNGKSGRLICQTCKTWYKIQDGIIDLLPLSLRRQDLYALFAVKYRLTENFHYEGKSSDAKKKQIEFFALDSAHYENQITMSPYFSALDELVFNPWLRRSITDKSIVLEVGTGTGRQCTRVAATGAEVVGIDISEEMLRIAMRVLCEHGLQDRAALVVADVEKLPFRDSFFNACIAVGTLHHVPNPAIALKRMVAALKNGAYFFSYDPHQSQVRFIFDWLMRIWKLYDEQASDEPLMQERQFMAWMNEAGLKAKIRISTYLPPHLFYCLRHNVNFHLLKYTDAIASMLPGIRKLGGMLVAEGYKAEKSPNQKFHDD